MARAKKSICPMSDAFEELPNNMLPAYLNVIKYYNEVKICFACTKQSIIHPSLKYC